jgi:hypothetical protein
MDINLDGSRKTQSIFAAFTLSFGICLYFFYLKYVPLVLPYQAILIPILFAVFVLTAVRLQWGILFFTFCFPLINGLPYFFGIFEPIPHAPAALVLFLFFFLGWLVHHCFQTPKLSFNRPVFKPIILLSILICISAVLTFLRYANFFPFLTDRVYEFIVNVDGVTSGGAIMSVVFFALNYLTGFVFFFILLNTVSEAGFVKRISRILCLSTCVSLAFGMFQHIGNLQFGNNPISIQEGLINATFKDALSFGAFTSMALPLILGLLLMTKGREKIFYLALFVLAATMLFHSGSRSAVLSAGLSLALFFFVGLKSFFQQVQVKSAPSKKRILPLSIGIAVIIVMIFSLTILREDIFHSRAVARWEKLAEQGVSGLDTSQRASLWKIASRVMSEYPVTGIGIGGFIIEVSNFSKSYGIPIQCSESAENYFLQAGTELGILGLFLVSWIFWEIFKQIRRHRVRFILKDRDKFFLTGAAVGLFAFFINAQFHSYIGSYEVKYAFWLLAALVFSQGRDPRAAEEKTGFNKIAAVAGVTAVLVTGAWQLWNATHSLSLKSKTEQLGIKQDFGFYEYEKTQEGEMFRWTREYGGLTVNIEQSVIRIPMLASHPDIKQNPVRVRIYLIKDFFKRKMLLEDVRLSNNAWRVFEYRLQEEINRDVILLVKVGRTWNPLRIQGVPDPRNLGVALGEVRFSDDP